MCWSYKAVSVLPERAQWCALGETKISFHFSRFASIIEAWMQWRAVFWWLFAFTNVGERVLLGFLVHWKIQPPAYRVGFSGSASRGYKDRQLHHGGWGHQQDCAVVFFLKYPRNVKSVRQRDKMSPDPVTSWVSSGRLFNVLVQPDSGISLQGLSKSYHLTTKKFSYQSGFQEARDSRTTPTLCTGSGPPWLSWVLGFRSASNHSSLHELMAQHDFRIDMLPTYSTLEEMW